MTPDVAIRPQVAGGTSFGSDASGGAVGAGHRTSPAALVRGHESDLEPGHASDEHHLGEVMKCTYIYIFIYMYLCINKQINE